MMEHKDRQELIERPALEDDALEDLCQTLGEAIKLGRLVTLRVFKPPGNEELDMVPQQVVDGKLRGLDRDGDRMSVAMVDVVGVTIS